MNGKTTNKTNGKEPRATSEKQKIRESSGAPEDSADSNWQRDIERRDYYYDDSHGYRVYNPDERDEENDED